MIAQFRSFYLDKLEEVDIGSNDELKAESGVRKATDKVIRELVELLTITVKEILQTHDKKFAVDTTYIS